MNVPTNPDGATPMMVKGCLLRKTVRPTTSRIVMKMIVPIGVAQNDIRRAVWPVFICRVKEAAEIGL